MYKLISLEINHITDKYIHYTIEVEEKRLFKAAEIKTYKCFKEKMFSSNYFTSTGDRMWHKYSDLDKAINAILDISTEQNYYFRV